MAANRKGRYSFTEKDIEMSKTTSSDVKDAKCYTYEEALDLTGHGKYNIGLLFACFMVIIAMGIDIFGLGIIVTAATCDLGLSLQQIGVLSSMPFAGIIVMSYPWGYLSDTKGRRLVLLWAMGGSFISAVLSSLAPTWQMLAALRFISSALSSAAESATYALLGECCNSRSRAKFMLLMTSALMLTPTLYYVWGYFITKMNFTFYIVGIAYRPWRLLTLVMALPLGIGALLLWFFRESPKFLASVGRKEEAVDALRRMYEVNGGKAGDYPVTEISDEDCRDSEEQVGQLTLRSLWVQIAPLFKPPLLGRTLLLYYLTFVIYIANNSFAIILPTIFNVFFTSYASSSAGLGFCDIFANANANSANTTTSVEVSFVEVECTDRIEDNTILAGCAHGLSFFVLNTLISQCAGKRKILTITILLIAAVAAIVINLTGEALSGLVLFYIYLTTAMVFGVVSSYFVTLYPTSYRGMVACLGMMVARLSAFTGTNVVSAAITDNCSATFYGAAVLVISGAIAAWFLPSDKEDVK